ncbi:hypothetical protein [Piscibacillus halophilus]|uniref:hypothetical protein n=1 Tax=Piscibacillus halophilus TaxID=571933 RepID=UPI00240A8532|nr:hypothetical protein [Piscibacillus halophilus]
MDDRLQRIVDEIYEKFGLTSYVLKRHHLDRQVDCFQNTYYTLTTEWFPLGVEEPEDGSNPTGTAVIEVNIHTKRVCSAVFVQETTYADGVQFPDQRLDTIVSWIEDETGLTYGEQFCLEKEEPGNYLFYSCWQGIITSPVGSIKVKLNSDNCLLFFSIIEPFPLKELIERDTFMLEIDQLEETIYKQCLLLDYPDMNHETITPIYGFEEVYITNKGKETVSIIQAHPASVVIDYIVTWDTLSPFSYREEELLVKQDITVEEAWSKEPSPDTKLITEEEKLEAIKLTRQFLSNLYNEDSGRWSLKTLHRENGFILATLNLVNDPFQLGIPRKLVIFINAEQQKVINYIDNKFFQDVFASYERIGNVKLSQEEAYNLLKPYITLTPRYVYQSNLKKYVLCGKLDCDIGINATNGKIQYFD